MKTGESSKVKLSRRSFLSSAGASAAGLLFAPYLKSGAGLAYGHNRSSGYLAQVAITQNDNYTRSVIKQKVQHLFDSLGGISDIVKAGDKVAIKINLTGDQARRRVPSWGSPHNGEHVDTSRGCARRGRVAH